MGARRPTSTIEPEAEAVDADVVADGGALDPGNVDFKLEAGLAGDKVRGKMEREEERDERGEERDPVGQFGAIGYKRDKNRACQRHQQDKGENDGIECFHCQCPIQCRFN